MNTKKVLMMLFFCCLWQITHGQIHSILRQERYPSYTGNREGRNSIGTNIEFPKERIKYEISEVEIDDKNNKEENTKLLKEICKLQKEVLELQFKELKERIEFVQKYIDTIDNNFNNHSNLFAEQELLENLKKSYSSKVAHLLNSIENNSNEIEKQITNNVNNTYDQLVEFTTKTSGKIEKLIERNFDYLEEIKNELNKVIVIFAKKIKAENGVSALPKLLAPVFSSRIIPNIDILGRRSISQEKKNFLRTHNIHLFISQNFNSSEALNSPKLEEQVKQNLLIPEASSLGLQYELNYVFPIFFQRDYIKKKIKNTTKNASFLRRDYKKMSKDKGDTARKDLDINPKKATKEKNFLIGFSSMYLTKNIPAIDGDTTAYNAIKSAGFLHTKLSLEWTPLTNVLELYGNFNVVGAMNNTQVYQTFFLGNNNNFKRWNCFFDTGIRADLGFKDSSTSFIFDMGFIWTSSLEYSIGTDANTFVIPTVRIGVNAKLGSF